jgi:OOP family OmpA-OmpF porin
MMTKHYFKVFFFLMISALLISCAMQKRQTAFKPLDLSPKLQAGHYVQKVDNVMIVLDASGSMSEPYKRKSKLSIAKEIVSRMNQTIPDVTLSGALRTFGQSAWPLSKKTTLTYGPREYTKEGLEEALKTIKLAGGRSPSALAIDAASEDLKPTHGDIAVVIVSDGKEMDNSPVMAAEKMKSLFRDRLCIYTVLVGNDPAGKSLMERVAAAGRCGFSVDADRIASSEDMAGFVEKVFLEKAEAMDSDGDGVRDDLDKCPKTPKGVKVNRFGCPIDTDRDGVYDYLDQCPNTASGIRVDQKGCPLDSDGDGVPDSMDQCPGTPKGAKVNDQGCWVLEQIRFDTGKSTIKAQAYPALDAVVAVLKRNPTLKVEIQGHSDNIGSEAYNRKLSGNRARAVMEYLVRKGVRAERLSAEGYGSSRPIASNDTPEGRTRNRRVELTPMP